MTELQDIIIEEENNLNHRMHNKEANEDVNVQIFRSRISQKYLREL